MNVQETAAGIGLQENESVRSLLERNAPKLAAALLSLLMNRASLPGGYCPFGAAFMAAVPQPYAAAAAVGGVIGCLTDSGLLLSMTGLRHISALLAVGGIRWALGELRRVNTARFYPFFTALAGVLLTNTVINGTTGSILSYSTVFFVIEGVMAGLAAMLFSGASHAVTYWNSGIRLSRQSTAAVLITLCAAAVPIGRLTVYGVSPGLILLHAAVLSVLPAKREVGGAVGGIAAGCVAALSRYSLLQGAVTPMAALMAGYAVSYGRVFAVSVYIAACFAGTLTSGRVDYIYVTEAAVGGVLACLIPTEWTERLLASAGLTGNGEPIYTMAEKHVAADRLKAAAAALTGVSTVIERVSEGLEKKEERERRNSADECVIYRRAFSKVCAGCPVRPQCLYGMAAQLPMDVTALTAGLKRDGSVSGAEISEVLGRRCVREDELAGEINSGYGYYLASRSGRTRISQARSVIHEQLEGVGLMLAELGDELDAVDGRDAYVSEQLISALRQCGYTVDGVQCTVNRSGRMSVTLALRDGDGVSLRREEIAAYVGECLETAFDEPIWEEQDGGVCVRLLQKQRYRMTVGAAQHCHTGERLCGDAYEAFDDREGGACMVLSDGMGSGGRAAVDGAMACGLFSRLLRGGFGFDSAVRIVNAALMMKSEDESLSTLDCLRVNLFNGRAMFYKAGAAQSYHVRDGVVNRIDIESLPLGILRKTDTARYTFTAEEGDLLVMISDGVPTDSSLWFEKLLERYEGQPPQEFAGYLLNRAAERRPAGEDDDITVIVGLIDANE